MNPKDNESNMQNGNWGTKGTNKQWDDAQTNRNRQLQETRARKGGKQPCVHAAVKTVRERTFILPNTKLAWSPMSAGSQRALRCTFTAAPKAVAGISRVIRDNGKTK